MELHCFFRYSRLPFCWFVLWSWSLAAVCRECWRAMKFFDLAKKKKKKFFLNHENPSNENHQNLKRSYFVFTFNRKNCQFLKKLVLGNSQWNVIKIYIEKPTPKDRSRLLHLVLAGSSLSPGRMVFFHWYPSWDQAKDENHPVGSDSFFTDRGSPSARNFFTSLHIGSLSRAVDWEWGW